MVKNSKEIRKKELIDYYHQEIIKEDEKSIKKKKKGLVGIRRKLKRNHIFYYISRHAGKEAR